MKVLLLNGSPRKNGCTYSALEEVQKTLKECDIESYIFQIGFDSITGCRACGACAKLGKCSIDDKVNEFVDMAVDYDAFVFGTPVYYASANGTISSFLDRAFFSNAHCGKKAFEQKPGFVVASARRSGTTATLDQLYKYFTISQMPIISGRYWNMVHGRTPDDVKQDLEGLQNLRIASRNLAWILKCIELGKKNNILAPQQEKTIMTDFIR